MAVSPPGPRTVPGMHEAFLDEQMHGWMPFCTAYVAQAAAEGPWYRTMLKQTFLLLAMDDKHYLPSSYEEKYFKYLQIDLLA